MTDTASKTESVIKIQGLHHAGIPVNDMDRAVEFYTKVLGMEVKGMLGGDGRGHFFGGRLPEDVRVNDPQSEAEYQAYKEFQERAHPGKDHQTKLGRLQAGDVEVVLFLRPEPLEQDTLAVNGVFHQSFRISKADMDRLAELKRQGNSGIRFSNGPALRWPEGRAIYMWDTEGNYLELETKDESPEDLKAQYTVPK